MVAGQQQNDFDDPFNVRDQGVPLPTAFEAVVHAPWLHVWVPFHEVAYSGGGVVVVLARQQHRHIDHADTTRDVVGQADLFDLLAKKGGQSLLELCHA